MSAIPGSGPYDGGKHPWDGETIPNFQPTSDRYTWAKAPRYGNKVVQTGPLAELLIAGDGLIPRSMRRKAEAPGCASSRGCGGSPTNSFTPAACSANSQPIFNGEHYIAPGEGGEIDGEGFGLADGRARCPGSLGEDQKWRHREISNRYPDRLERFAPRQHRSARGIGSRASWGLRCRILTTR